MTADEIYERLQQAYREDEDELDLSKQEIRDVDFLEALSRAGGAGELPDLLEIRFDETQIGDLTLAELARVIRDRSFRNLKKLWFADTKAGNAGLIELARAVKAGCLPKLELLCFQGARVGNAGLIELASAGKQLLSLTDLDFIYCKMGDKGLAALARAAQAGHLRNLETIGFSDTKVGDVGMSDLFQAARSGRLRELREIWISNTRVGDKSMIALGQAARAGHLPNLETIVGFRSEVGNEGLMALAQASQAGGFPRLRYLDLNPSRVDIIDSAVLASHEPRRIFETALHGVCLFEGRVMFVGMGNVGKSWLHRRCFLDEVVHAREPRHETHDFDLVRPESCRWKPRIRVDGRVEEIVPRVWDFGGQLILHGIHETFLSEDDRTVYLLVASADRVPGLLRDHKGEEIGNGVVYWLKMIRHFSGDNVPVIVAITQCDKIRPGEERKVDEPLSLGVGTSLAQTNPEALGVALDVWIKGIVDQCSAADSSRTIDALRSAIESAMSQLEGIKTRRVTNSLIAIRSKVEGELATRALVSKGEYQEWCIEVGIGDEDDQDSYLRILHIMGTLFYFGRTGRESEDLVRDVQEQLRCLPPGRKRMMKKEPTHILQSLVANPHWLKQAVYSVTRVANKSPWIELGDIDFAIREADLLCQRGVAGRAFTTHRLSLDYVREFMSHVELCFFDEDKQEYLFPRGLKRRTLILDSHQWPKTFLHWDFVPEAAYYRFLVAMHRRGYVSRGDQNDYLHSRESVVIRYQSTMAEVRFVFAEDQIEIRYDPLSQGVGREKLYEMVREQFVGEHIGNVPTSETKPYAGVTNSPGAPGMKKARGRPSNPENAKVDQRIAEAWYTGSYATYEQLAKEVGVKEGRVKKAVDNERKRRKKSSS